MTLLLVGLFAGVLIGAFASGRGRPLLFVALLGILSTVAAFDKGSGPETVSRIAAGSDTTSNGGSDTGIITTDPVTGETTTGSSGPADPATTQKQIAQANAGLQCARGKNGGATDTGVTGDKIKLAATVVQSGIGASFLGQSPVGIQAVVRKVNSNGGVCGRLLDIKLVDDGWDANRGLGFIRNFISEGVFALPVTPSSEGLTAAIESKDISKAGIPVVGSDGMLIQQYRDPYVWPVATATISTMRVMARYGYEKGARSFGIVYDKFYKFGREGADAFKEYIEKQPGAQLKSFTGILPGQASYSSDIQQFNSACNPCDFVALLLEPSTAETWIAGRPNFGAQITSGAQTLFNERFASNCGKACAGMLLWTGYNPPVGSLATTPAVSAYVQDVKSISPTVDPTNQFLQGAYLGMNAFVEALKAVGPNLTRERLKQVLDGGLVIPPGLSGELRWKSGAHHANIRAQAFSIVVAQGSFAGFRDEQTGLIADPALE